MRELKEKQREWQGGEIRQRITEDEREENLGESEEYGGVEEGKMIEESRRMESDKRQRRGDTSRKVTTINIIRKGRTQEGRQKHIGINTEAQLFSQHVSIMTVLMLI